jgi:molybdopterin synthase sulfur carrier subunit
MRVRVRLFASLRDAAGVPEAWLELAPGSTAESAWGCLVGDFPALAPRRASLAAAVNRRYAPFDTALQDGDEVVFIPPVSGG